MGPRTRLSWKTDPSRRAAIAVGACHPGAYGIVGSACAGTLAGTRRPRHHSHSPTWIQVVAAFFRLGLTIFRYGNNVPIMKDKTLQALSAALLRMLRPLIRIVLRHGISYGSFADLVKWVYVDIATREFAIPGRKQSVSRVAVITGLTRKEVNRIQQRPRPDDQAAVETYNRAARVIGGWLRDNDFLGPDQQPSALDLEGEGATFGTLVKRYSGDVPARAILDELLRVGAVAYTDASQVQLIARGYIPATSEIDKLQILGADLAALITTIDHNLDPQDSPPLFQRKVSYDNLPDEVLVEFREHAGQKAQALLEELNDWLAARDRDTNPQAKGSGRNEAGFGIYYFENPDDGKQD